MEKTALIWFIIFGMTAGLIYLPKDLEPVEHNGLCTNMFLNNMEKLKKLENCSIVIGDLKIVALEKTKTKHFVNLTFPKLKEVTGYMVVYRVSGLQTLSTLLPNLARIRGNTLLYNYALMVFDIVDLTEIGLHSLLKIDRGGVIIWGGPLTCYVNTINWNAIAPRSRHVLSKPDKHAHCNFPCTCSSNPATNYCWNNLKCQIFLEGPESLKCSNKCFGCRNIDPNNCTLCRNYTYKEECVSRCPGNTFILSESNYCLTKDECIHLNRWVFNRKCITDCPKDFTAQGAGVNKTCVPCPNCYKTCSKQNIQTLDTIQLAEKCVFINGSLTIHTWSIPNVADELQYYLKNIVEVTDYIAIYGSISITSLDFLSSLQRISGRNLFNGKYSLAVHDMSNLQSLFTSNVTRNLKIEKGTLRFYNNPMLCMHHIKKLKGRFPIAPNELDIPQAMNGYGGSCIEVSLKLSVQVKNETFALATFYPSSRDVVYSVLYVRIPHGMNKSIVPEACSDSEWFAINVPDRTTDVINVALSSLRPASTYAICIEKYEPASRQLARSNIIKFSTHVGKPEPPFILELVSNATDEIVIRWVDHLDYKPFITRYELDVRLIDISDDDVVVRDRCGSMDDEWYDTDLTRHAKVMRPPPNYERGCESMCGVLSFVPAGTMVEDYFNICETIGDCQEVVVRPKNSTVNGVFKSLSLDIDGRLNMTKIGGLNPFRDYKFSLRACTKDLCSRSSKSVVRTLHSKVADVAFTTFANVSESGYIYIEWEPPNVTNGPLLAYTIEIYPDIKVSDANHVVPQTKCVPGNETNLTLKSNKASTFLVRVCSTTLAYAYICNEWKKIESTIPAPATVIHETAWWWSGILFGLFICIFSWILGWQWKLREPRSDTIPLCDATSMNRQESIPPAAQLSDLVLSYGSLFELRDLSHNN